MYVSTYSVGYLPSWLPPEGVGSDFVLPYRVRHCAQPKNALKVKIFFSEKTESFSAEAILYKTLLRKRSCYDMRVKSSG